MWEKCVCVCVSDTKWQLYGKVRWIFPDVRKKKSKVKHGRWGEVFPGKFPALQSSLWPPDRSQVLQVQSYNLSVLLHPAPFSCTFLVSLSSPSTSLCRKTQRRAAEGRVPDVPSYSSAVWIKEQEIQEGKSTVCVCVCVLVLVCLCLCVSR